VSIKRLITHIDSWKTLFCMQYVEGPNLKETLNNTRVSIHVRERETERERSP